MYIRVSTDKQNKNGNGLSAQLNGITEYCKYKNYVVKDELIFVDGARSAKNLNRPAFQEMYDLIKSGLINKVIIYKRDRIVRDMMDLYFIRNEISQKYECAIESVQDGIIGWSTGNEMFMQNIYTAKDNLELIQVSERTKDCLYASALKGNYTLAHLPYGMKRINQSKAIEPTHGSEKEIDYGLKYIVENSTLNRNVISHFNKVNLLGVTWNLYKLRRFVSTNIYGGDLITPSFTIENHTPAIVNKDLLRRAYETVYKKKRRERRTYIFRGYVKCSECGCLLDNKSTYKKNRNGSRKLYLYYFCPKCKKRMNQNTIIDLIGSSLDYKVNNENIQQTIDEKISLIRRRELCILENNQSFIDGLISEEIWKKELESMRVEIICLKKEMNNLGKTEGSIFSTLSLVSQRKKLQQNIDYITIDFANLNVDIILK